MLSKGFLANRAAFEVCHESVSYLTPEYERMFGLPPARDASESQVA